MGAIQVFDHLAKADSLKAYHDIAQEGLKKPPRPSNLFSRLIPQTWTMNQTDFANLKILVGRFNIWKLDAPEFDTTSKQILANRQSRLVSNLLHDILIAHERSFGRTLDRMPASFFVTCSRVMPLRTYFRLCSVSKRLWKMFPEIRGERIHLLGCSYELFQRTKSFKTALQLLHIYKLTDVQINHPGFHGKTLKKIGLPPSAKGVILSSGHYPPRIFDADLAVFTSLTGLESLGFHDCKFIGSFVDLKPLVRLASLSFTGCAQDSVLVRELAALPNLRCVSFRVTTFSDRFIHDVSNLTRLRKLSLYGEVATRSAYNSLTTLTNLNALQITNIMGRLRSDLSCVGRLTTLTNLFMFGCIASESDISWTSLVKLENLTIDCSALATLNPLTTLGSLKRLYVCDFSASHGSYYLPLLKVTQLTSLTLQSCSGVDDQFAEIVAFGTSLKTITLPPKCYDCQGLENTKRAAFVGS